MSASEFLLPGHAGVDPLVTAIFSTFSLIETQRGFSASGAGRADSADEFGDGQDSRRHRPCGFTGRVFLLLAPTVHIWPKPLSLVLGWL